MSVEDRIQEHAVLQTLGFTTGRVFRLVLSECVLLSLIGGVLGIVAAWLTLNFTALSIGAEAVTVAFVGTPQDMAAGLAIAVAVGLLSGVIPAWRAAGTEIVPALRAR